MYIYIYKFVCIHNNRLVLVQLVGFNLFCDATEVPMLVMQTQECLRNVNANSNTVIINEKRREKFKKILCFNFTTPKMKLFCFILPHHKLCST